MNLDRVLFILVIAYLVNASPLLIKGNRPLDFNKKWKNKPILGKGKTIEGTIFSLVIGIFLAFIFNILDNWYGYFIIPLFSVLGDILGSFIKRRTGKKRGYPIPLLDQLDFLFFIFPFIYFYSNIIILLIIIQITLVMHIITNYLAYKLKIKQVPW